MYRCGQRSPPAAAAMGYLLDVFCAQNTLSRMPLPPSP